MGHPAQAIQYAAPGVSANQLARINRELRASDVIASAKNAIALQRDYQRKQETGFSKMKKISFVVGVGIRGPIAVGDYAVNQASIAVDYPPSVQSQFRTLKLPEWHSTVFTVSWSDTTGKDEKALLENTYSKHLVVHKALAYINELLQAFKLVRVGHIDSCGMRTIGINDTLFHYSLIDGQQTGQFNALLRGQFSTGIPPEDRRYHDFFDTTALAKQHIGIDSYPVARRFLRCYELLEHGFYSEAFIVSFSILDAIVQDMLNAKLTERGMEKTSERSELLRGIKENRLHTFLGPLLYILTGHSISSLWSHAESALPWINSKRNKIAHAGYQADYSTAAQGIYACIRILVALNSARLITAEFSVEFFRHAKITAAWTAAPPDWVPSGEAAEAMDFTS